MIGFRLRFKLSFRLRDTGRYRKRLIRAIADFWTVAFLIFICFVTLSLGRNIYWFIIINIRYKVFAFEIISVKIQASKPQQITARK